MSKETVLGLLWVFWVIVLLVIYHKIFTVYYFSLLNGLLKEFITAGILGGVMTALTLQFWYIAAIIIISIGWLASRKSRSKVPLVMTIVVAVLIGNLGTGINRELNGQKKEKVQLKQNYEDNYPEEKNEYKVNENGYLTESEDSKENDNTQELYYEVEYTEEQQDAEYEYENEYSSEEYVFENSDRIRLTEVDCEGLSADECKIARNEIYARHGRLFKDESLQAYFDNCSWYRGEILPDDFSEDMLNAIEKNNLEVISAYESTMGYR